MELFVFFLYPVWWALPSPRTPIVAAVVLQSVARRGRRAGPAGCRRSPSRETARSVHGEDDDDGCHMIQMAHTIATYACLTSLASPSCLPIQRTHAVERVLLSCLHPPPFARPARPACHIRATSRPPSSLYILKQYSKTCMTTVLCW